MIPPVPGSPPDPAASGSVEVVRSWICPESQAAGSPRATTLSTQIPRASDDNSPLGGHMTATVCTLFADRATNIKGDFVYFSYPSLS